MGILLVESVDSIPGVYSHAHGARKQFQAKTDWIVNLGAYEMVRGDQKDFGIDNWKCGIAVLEVTTPEPVGFL